VCILSRALKTSSAACWSLNIIAIKSLSIVVSS
jgi:hypothetical protein